MSLAVVLSVFIGETKVDEIYFWLGLQITVGVDHYVFRLQVIEGSPGSVHILEDPDELVGDFENFLDSGRSFELT
jgi:hypothetical protein